MKLIAALLLLASASPARAQIYGAGVGGSGSGGSSGSSTITVNASQFTGDGGSSNPLTANSSSVTLQGNAFNGASQIVRLDGTSKLPAVNGSQLTDLPAIASVTSNSGQFSGNGTNPANQLALLSSSVTLQGQNVVLRTDGSTVTLNGQDSAGFGAKVLYGVDLGSVTSRDGVVVGSTLTVIGNAMSVGGSTFSIAGGSVNVGARFFVGGSTLVAGGGLVGIGTTSPLYRLDIRNAARDTMNVESSASNGTGLIIKNTGTGGRTYEALASANGNGEGGGLFMISDVLAGIVARFLIDSSGNVAIGGTKPGAFFDVQGISALRGNVTVSANSTMTVTGNAFSVGGGTLVASGGKVSVGTTTTSTALSVYGVITSSTPIPSISCSAGTGVLGAESTNQHGNFVAGTAATSCTVTFTTAWPKKPSCFCNDETNTLLTKAVGTTTTLVCSSLSALTGDTITYGCQGAP